MLLGAARALAERKNFDGHDPPHLPAGGGEWRAVRRSWSTRVSSTDFPAIAVFALHNEPNRPSASSLCARGRSWRRSTRRWITVHGCGGHGAEPQETADPIVCGASMVMALQTIVARNIHPMDPSVVTVGAFHAAPPANIIPERAEIVVGIRSFDPGVRDGARTPHSDDRRGSSGKLRHCAQPRLRAKLRCDDQPQGENRFPP